MRSYIYYVLWILEIIFRSILLYFQLNTNVKSDQFSKNTLLSNSFFLLVFCTLDSRLQRYLSPIGGFNLLWRPQHVEHRPFSKYDDYVQ